MKKYILLALIFAVLISGCIAQKESKEISAENEAPIEAEHETEASKNVTYKEFNLAIQRTGFSPSTITVIKGDNVRIYAKAEYDPTVTHSFTIDAYGINKIVTAKITDKTANIIEFTADKAGIFSYYCKTCPTSYPRISGQLVVKEE